MLRTSELLPRLLDLTQRAGEMGRDDVLDVGREIWRVTGGNWYEPWSTFAKACGLSGEEAMASWRDFGKAPDGPNVIEAWGAFEREAPKDLWESVRNAEGFDYLDAHDNPLPRCPIGIAEIDAALGGGIVAGTYMAIGGGPGAGKTALAIQSAYIAAFQGQWMPLVYSVELGAQDVWDRLLTVHSYCNRDLADCYWARTKGPDDGFREAYEDFQARFGERIAIRAEVTDVRQVVSEVTELAGAGYRVFPIVDHLHVLNPPDDRMGEYEGVSAMSEMLRETAKRCKVPMLVLAELRNIGEKEADQPRVTWFRGSGKVGYDAGAAMILMRDGDRRGEVTPTRAHIVKNRYGTSGVSIPLSFLGGRNWMVER